jgi:hypothetical protein
MPTQFDMNDGLLETARGLYPVANPDTTKSSCVARGEFSTIRAVCPPDYSGLNY